MRIMEITETRSYNLFDVGERVRPTAGEGRHGLEMRVYVVTRCDPPLYLEDEATVGLEGLPYGHSTTYLTSVDDPQNKKTEKPPAGEGGREGEAL